MRGPLGAFFRLFNKVFDKSTNADVGLTKMVARRITMGVVLILIVSFAMGFLGNMIPGGFMPEEGDGS